jgi:hypothetical protein
VYIDFKIFEIKVPRQDLGHMLRQPASSVTFLWRFRLLSSHCRSSLILFSENCIRESSVSAPFFIRSFNSPSLYLGRVLLLLEGLEFSLSLNLTPIRGTLSQNTLTI